MQKRYYLYMFLGIIFAMTIVPGLFVWLGFPTPSQGIANMFTAVLGESSFVNNLIAFSILGMIIVLIILGTSKVIKTMEKPT